MTVVSAARKEFGQRRLRQRRAAQGECELAVQDLFHVASSRNPADAIPWRDRLGEGAAVDRVAMRIQGHEWLRTLFTEVDIAIDVVLDQRNPVPREQFQDGLLLLVGHGATQGVVELDGNRHALTDVVPSGLRRARRSTPLLASVGNSRAFRSRVSKTLRKPK